MATKRPFQIAPILLVLAAFGATACEEKVECAPGTENRDGTCVAICEEGTEPDPNTGACVPVCVPGTERDASTGICMPLNAECVSGEVWEPESQQCLPVEGLCASGTVWVAGEAACVPLEEVRVPDQMESDGPNDWVPGERTCEQFQLPAVGERWSIGGRIDEPDRRQLGPDMDCWNFETEGPTLLRIHADGYGGAAPGFQVILDDPEVDGSSVYRYGAGTSSAAVTRDLFLPHAGRYAVVVTDVMHLLAGGGGVVRGSEDMGYYAEIEQLPMPEPQQIEGTGVIARGRWGADLPADGTNLPFYEIPVEKNTLMHLGLHATSAEILPIFVALGADGSVIEASARHQPFASAGDRDGTMLMVADYEWWFTEQEGESFTITREPQPFEMIDEGVSTKQAHRPSWRPPGAMPSVYYGFEVTGGDVYRVELESSTGFTCFAIWDHLFSTQANAVGCYLISSPEYEHEITFVPESDGLWVLSVIDWSDGNWVDGGIVSLPARDFEFEAGIFPQTPLSMGDLSTPHTSTEQLTDEQPVRWLELSPSEENQAFRFESTGELTPLILPYDFGDILAAPSEDYYIQPSNPLIFRVPDGRTRLLAISDPLDGTGSFELHAERYEPLRLDVPAGGDPLNTTVDLPAGEPFHLEVLAEEPSDLHLTVTPPQGVEVEFFPAFDDLRDAPEYRQTAAAGEPLRVVQGVAPFPFAFRIVGPLGQPLEQDVEVHIEARLVPLASEQEPNDFPEESTELPLRTPIAGEKNGVWDADWYRIEIGEAEVLEISTRPLGLSRWPDAHISLFDEDLRKIDDMERLDSGNWSHLRVPMSGPTTIYARVDPFDAEGYGYVVEAEAYNN